MAAIELINVLRPTIAISWYIVFAAVAIHEHLECVEKWMVNEDDYRSCFVNEVRRFYPFAPFMGARVAQPFNWNGCQFTAGSLVLLDMYGTNHDERLWLKPEVFDPDRFKGRDIRPFDFLAQGGGNVSTGHRCPGEKITIALLETALQFLITQMTYTVPQQDLSIDLSRMPAVVKSGFKISNVKQIFTEIDK
jgi:fatty-acid peroxygenase